MLWIVAFAQGRKVSWPSAPMANGNPVKTPVQDPLRNRTAKLHTEYSG
jgi:hypothetical protein